MSDDDWSERPTQPDLPAPTRAVLLNLAAGLDAGDLQVVIVIWRDEPSGQVRASIKAPRELDAADVAMKARAVVERLLEGKDPFDLVADVSELEPESIGLAEDSGTIILEDIIDLPTTDDV